MSDFESRKNGKKTRFRSPPEHTRFKLGNPGRPKGSRNKLSEAFIDELYAEWLEGGRKALERVRRENPVTFLRICVSNLPREIEVTHGNPLEEWSDEELAALDAISAAIRGQAADEDEGGEQKAA